MNIYVCMYVCMYVSKSIIMMDKGTLKWFKTNVSVRQGCILSPMLFNLFLEQTMLEALDSFQGEVSIAGHRITNLRFCR